MTWPIILCARSQGNYYRWPTHAVLLVFFFKLCFPAIALSQSADKAGQASDSPRHQTHDGITSEQADAILSELRLIRQLLEQQPQLQKQQSAISERVQMSVASDWYALGRVEAPVTGHRVHGFAVCIL
jgi:hypothetical protein